MTDKSTDTTAEMFQHIDFESLPEPLQKMLKKAMDDGVPTSVFMVSKMYAQLTADVFTAITLCTCLAHNRIRDLSSVRDRIMNEIGSFIASEAAALFGNPCEKTLTKILNRIMLKSRSLCEDELGVKRFDGTAKGEECRYYD